MTVDYSSETMETKKKQKNISQILNFKRCLFCLFVMKDYMKGMTRDLEKILANSIFVLRNLDCLRSFWNSGLP